MRRDLAGSRFFAAITLTMVAMIFIAISGGNGWAADAAYVSKNLPRAYSGTFQWHEGGDPQKVTITIGKVATSDAGDVVAGGKGQYVTANGTTNIVVYMIILPEKLLVKIFERDPKGSSRFQVGGSHVGRFSQDLKTIQAVWTSKKDGKKGDLILKAMK